MSNPSNPSPPPSVFKHTDTNGPVLMGVLPSRTELLHALAQLPHDERVAILSEAAQFGTVIINGHLPRTMTRPGPAFDLPPEFASNRASRRAAKGGRR